MRASLALLLLLVLFVTAALAASYETEWLRVDEFAHPAAPLRVAVVCGMHPRERVATELCTRWAALLQRAEPLSAFNFTLLTVKHRGAALHDWCWRGNWHEVDLNRDWPVAAACYRANPECFPHTRPYRATETVALSARLDVIAPHVLLSMHSGALAALVPFDCDARLHVFNLDFQLEFARWLTDKRRVPVGRLMEVLQYKAFGTLTDYALSSLGVPVALALELYEPGAAVEECSEECCPELFSPTDTAERQAVLAEWDSVLYALLSLRRDDAVVGQIREMREYLRSEEE